MTFKGVYRYADEGELEAALAEVEEYLAGIGEEGFSISYETELVRGDLAITVDIETISSVQALWVVYESIVETLAGHAIDGKVEATIEGGEGVETYPASAP